MDSTLNFWGILFLSLPIATYLLTVYQTRTRVAKESQADLSRHMFAVEKEIQRLTKKNAERGGSSSLAIQGFLFAVVIFFDYLNGQFSEKTALVATLGWCIYLSAAAWEAGQIKGCRKALEILYQHLIEEDRQVSVSLEKAAKLPPGLFEGLGSITVTDESSPDKNKPEFTLEPFKLREFS